MRRDKLGQPRVNFRPHLVRHHRLERRARNLQAQIAPALMARVDDRNFRGRLAVRRGAGEEMRDGFDRVLRGREADALQAVAAQAPRASPATERDARRACLARPRGFRRQSRNARLRASRARTASRAARKAIPASSPGCAAGARLMRWRSAGGRVARSDPGADFDIGKPAPAKLLADAGQRRLEILMDVVRQRLERRHVDDLGRIRRAAPRGPAAPDRRSRREKPRASCPIPSARR